MVKIRLTKGDRNWLARQDYELNSYTVAFLPFIDKEGFSVNEINNDNNVSPPFRKLLLPKNWLAT